MGSRRLQQACRAGWTGKASRLAQFVRSAEAGRGRRGPPAHHPLHPARPTAPALARADRRGPPRSDRLSGQSCQRRALLCVSRCLAAGPPPLCAPMRRRVGRSGLLCALVSGALSCGGDGGGGASGGGDDDGGGGVCVPGATYCAGEEEDEVWECNEDGTGGRFVEACPAGLTCSRGECVTACERAARDPSNVGCEFWAVDLDNEAFDMGLGASNDA